MDLFDGDTKKSAVFSPCRRWRYSLERIWQPELGLVQFIGLNPSTADETEDDPTIRRCIGFSRDWGYGGIVMSNIFAFRATDPKLMKAATDPIGPENDKWILAQYDKCEITVAAWGLHGEFRGRGEIVAEMLRYDLRHLGKTKHGQPRHPLYLRRSEPLRHWD